MDGGDAGDKDDGGGEEDAMAGGNDCRSDERATPSAVNRNTTTAQIRASGSLALLCVHHESGCSGGSSKVSIIKLFRP